MGSGWGGLVRAGAGLAAALSGLEGGAAGAGLYGVGVEDREAGLHQVVHVVYFGALQQRSAVGVHHQLDARVLDDEVVLLGRLSDSHPVLVAGAAAADDEYAQGGLPV